MVAPARAPLRTDRLRAVNEPAPVTVQVDDSGAPGAVRRLDGSTTSNVESINETWRIDDEWWRHTISRLYYEVMFEGGKRVVLFRDLITSNWYLQQP